MIHEKPFGGISGSTLKLIAVISMLIDHTGATVLRAILNLPDLAASPFWFQFWKTMYSYSRSIGRIAFPIFCFLIVEGFSHTRNVWKYAMRMFLFALLSEIPFDLALKGGWYRPDKQNVYFTLLIGLLVLIGFSLTEQLTVSVIEHFSAREATASNSKQSDQHLSHMPFLHKRFCWIYGIMAAADLILLLAGMRLAAYIDTDYNYKGVFLIAVLYLVQRYGGSVDHARLPMCFAGAMAVSWELPAPLGFFPVYLYNGKRGLSLKYLFYWFYPVHLLILHGIADYLIPLL